MIVHSAYFVFNTTNICKTRIEVFDLCEQELEIEEDENAKEYVFQSLHQELKPYDLTQVSDAYHLHFLRGKNPISGLDNPPELF